jgi:transmembrane sensor
MAKTDSRDLFSIKLDQAAAWHIRVRAPDAEEATWAAFTAWLDADPANRLAFDRVEDVDSEVETAALAEGAERETPELARFRQGRPQLRRASTLPAWVAGVTLVAASLILALVFWTGSPTPTDYTTHVGETKVVTLPDGTRIEMNTKTRILAQVDQRSRQVVLDYGEAVFHVAKDARHPFVVTVGDRTVSVIGTVFNILRSDGAITIFLAEGRVAISPRSGVAHDHETILSPGDQLTYSEATGATTVEKVDAEQAISWRQGYLVYRDAPLSKVVSDLNRYFPVPIAVESKIAAQRFSGVLRLDSESAVLQRIALFLRVSVDHTADGRINLRAAGGRH